MHAILKGELKECFEIKRNIKNKNLAGSKELEFDSMELVTAPKCVSMTKPLTGMSSKPYYTKYTPTLFIL